MENESEREEIEESSKIDHESSKPHKPNKPPRTVKTKVPEVEIRLFRRGKGPIDVFKSSLGGWDQNQLEVSDILEKYSFKSIFAFNPESGRGVSIRFNPRNGRSLLPYTDGSVIFIDGEPKDSMVKPITKIAIGIALMTFLIVMLFKETPDWMKRFNLIGGTFPPWVLACAVIVFTRLRKRTRDILKRYGW
ncbi:uncharacterized protein LOC122642036 [Telopea speciosissima]|uniref:uncharacterized protein LOC122642036 n=1 Tax=Telopea speciosissima TaxID=54955 RepID=UPI001CC70FB3|nr:uncharacterized protein LOC122642036 [Telopea speciosissima]